MSTVTAVLEPCIEQVNGHILIDLPWEKAESCQSFFRNHDVESVLHLDPINQEARLQILKEGIDRTQQLLTEWQQQKPAEKHMQDSRQDH